MRIRKGQFREGNESDRQVQERLSTPIAVSATNNEEHKGANHLFPTPLLSQLGDKATVM